jgi:hypothetical protein
MRTFIAVMCGLCAVGCTSWHLAEPTGPQVAPFGPAAPAVATVCVVRTSILAQAVVFPTHDNGVLVGATRGPTYFCYLAEPGAHTIDIEADEDAQATLMVAAGGRYFLHEEVDNILGYVKCRAVWVTEEAARALVADSDYQVLSGVPGEERLPAVPPYAPAAGHARHAAASNL